MELTGRQRRYLRSLGHHLRPVVLLGRSGLTESLLRQVDATLEDRELIKIRFGRGFEDDVKAALRAIVQRTRSALAGRVGRTALLYRPRDEDPKIRFPVDSP